MKKLLMLGGGFLQCYVIRRAKELGYRVLVLDANPEAMGFMLADEYDVINIVDEDACLRYAQKNQIDGVLTAATDFSTLTMSRIAEEMHLPGINYKSVKLIKNKAAVRRCLFENHADDTGISFQIDSIEQITKILPQIKFPIMVKPCDGSGSRGALKVEKSEDFPKACKYAMENSISHRAVAEPFIEGREYGVETFVNNYDIHVLGIMQKEMTEPPYYAELGHAMPSGLSKDMEDRVKAYVNKAIFVLGVNHGSVNMDLLITNSGDVHIIDVGARMGGNLIGSHIIPRGTGIEYMDNMIRAAVGDPTDFKRKWVPMPVATKILALKPGKVSSLPDFRTIATQYDVLIEHHLHVGDIINEYHTNLDGCGYVVANGVNEADAIMKAEKAKDIIDQNIIRET